MLYDMIDITDAVNVNLCTELYCFSCKSLLSVPPILINTEGKNLCGRCQKGIQNEACVRNVHYENLACQFYFPCRYIDEGCCVKKSFSKIKFHEEKCPYQIIKCSVKSCVWSGITTELVIHYNLHHQDLKLTNDCVKELAQNTDGCFMLVANEFHFLIGWICHESNLKLFIKSLNFLDSNSDVKFVCSLTTSENPTKLSTLMRLKTSTILDLDDLQNLSSNSLLFSMNAILSKDIINSRFQEIVKIVCPCCLLQMAPPILKCPEGHITCMDCTRADYDFCGQCVEAELHFTRARDLEFITISSLYTCKWEGCGENFSYRQIRAHEQCCSKRTFMCMHCFQWYGFLNEISSHNAVCQSRKYLCPVITNTEVTIPGTSNERLEYLLLAFKEIFWIIFKTTESGTNISVSNYGPISSFDWYCYEAELEHIEDSNFPLNKTFSISHKDYNEFTVDVPISDIEKFGGTQFYKITVRIILLNDENKSKNMAVNLRRFN